MQMHSNDWMTKLFKLIALNQKEHYLPLAMWIICHTHTRDNLHTNGEQKEWSRKMREFQFSTGIFSNGTKLDMYFPWRWRAATRPNEYAIWTKYINSFVFLFIELKGEERARRKRKRGGTHLIFVFSKISEFHSICRSYTRNYKLQWPACELTVP